MEWQPIETTPETGEFQAWVRRYDDGSQFWVPRAKLIDGCLALWGRVDYDIDDWDKDTGHLELMAWMPYPAPPTL